MINFFIENPNWLIFRNYAVCTELKSRWFEKYFSWTYWHVAFDIMWQCPVKQTVDLLLLLCNYFHTYSLLIRKFNYSNLQQECQQKTHSSLQASLSQIIAVTVKNLLLLEFGLSQGFPTILIPSLSGNDPTEKIQLDRETISWIGT